MPNERESSALKWRVWEQAWSQSRHLETMRGQYLGFFFTILLGVTALAAKQIADDALSTPSSLVVFSTLALSLDLLATFLLLAITRIGAVLREYGVILSEIQDEFRALEDPGNVPAWLRAPTASRGGGLPQRVRSIQGAAELVLRFAVLAFSMSLVAPAVRCLALAETPAATIVVCFAALLVGVVLAGGSFWALRATTGVAGP